MSDREPCPVCGRQPSRKIAAQSYLECDHGDWHLRGELQGPGFDPDGTKWDAMCRTIRARVVAEAREKVDRLPLDYNIHGAEVVRLSLVMSLLNNKEDAQ